jgi:hypothetical protein
MSFEFSITESDGVAHLTYSGDFKDGDSLQMWSEISVKMPALSSKKLLVEELPGALGEVKTTELYELGKYISENPVFSNTLIAVVFPGVISDETLRNSIFAAKVASNRGRAVRIFQANQEAMQWLFPDSIEVVLD